MENIFQNLDQEKTRNEIKSGGSNGIFTPGAYDIVDTKIYMWDDGEFGTQCEVVFTGTTGGTLIDQVRVKNKSNQTQSDLQIFMTNIALVTGKAKELDELKTTFTAIPLTPYTSSFKKEVKAKCLNIFANTKYTILTTTEISGGANKIFTSQKVILNQLFRTEDKASLAEIKEDKEDKGNSFKNYWTVPGELEGRTSIKWSNDNRFEEDPVCQSVKEYLSIPGNKFTKKVRELFQDGFSCAEVKAKLGGSTVAAVDVDKSDDELPNW